MKGPGVRPGVVVVMRKRCGCGSLLDRAPVSFFCASCRQKQIGAWRGRMLASRALALAEALAACGIVTAALVPRIVDGVVVVACDPDALACVLQRFRELETELAAGE